MYLPVSSKIDYLSGRYSLRALFGQFLEYVLQKNELQYIIQEQILLITNKQNIHQNLLQSIGNQNMVSAPPKQLPTTKIYPIKITNENIQYTFPFPCIWFLHTTTTKHNQSIHEITPVIVLEK